MKYLNLIFVFVFLASCTIEKSKKLSNVQASIDDVAHFFHTEKVNLNDFSDLELMLFGNDDYPEERDSGFPFMYYSMRGSDLQRSVLVKQHFFSILILDCPYQTSFGIFYKQNDRPIKLIDEWYYPDSVSFYQLDDTLLVCQLHWAENFGSPKSNISEYYFFGTKTGIFKYGYYCAGTLLQLNNFETNKEGVLLKEKKSGASILVLPDTLKQVNSSKILSGEIFKPHFTNFNKVSLGERL